MRNLLVAALALTALTSLAGADFVLVDDFDTYTKGTGGKKSDFSDIPNWTGDGGSKDYGVEVGVVATTGDQFLSAEKAKGPDTYGYRSIPTIADGTVGTLFFRVAVNESSETDWNKSDGIVFNAGLAGTSSPTGPADLVAGAGFETHKNASPVWSFLDAGTATATTEGVTFNPASTGNNNRDDSDGDGYFTADPIWMNVWMVVDNDADTYDVYITEGLVAANGDDLIGSGSLGATGDLDTFLFTLVSHGHDDWGLDDIYVDTAGANLGNPIPEPATMALLGLGGLGVVIRRRR